MGFCNSTPVEPKKTPKPRKAAKKGKKSEVKTKTTKLGKVPAPQEAAAGEFGSSVKNLESTDLLAIANAEPRSQPSFLPNHKAPAPAPAPIPHKSINPLAGSPRPLAVQLSGVESDETCARTSLAELWERQWQMHRADTRKRIAELQLTSELLDHGESMSDDDSSSRKCSMTPKETESAASAGRDFTPVSSRSIEPINPKNAHIPTARANVQHHNTEDDLWVVIRNRVYNLSGFQALHPGGSWVLMQVAGQDATAMFEQQHSATYVGQLREYYVGDVPKDERR